MGHTLVLMSDYSSSVAYSNRIWEEEIVSQSLWQLMPEIFLWAVFHGVVISIRDFSAIRRNHNLPLCIPPGSNPHGEELGCLPALKGLTGVICFPCSP